MIFFCELFFWFYINFTVFVCSRRQIQCLKCSAAPSPTETETAPQWQSSCKDEPSVQWFEYFSVEPRTPGKRCSELLQLEVGDTERERAPKKSHLRNKNKCKHLYFRNSSYDEWEHKYQTMRTTCLWWRKEWEKSFLCFPLKKKKNQQLLSCIHCSTEYAHSISLMSYSYTNVKHKLGSTFPCSIHQGCLMAHPLLCS